MELIKSLISFISSSSFVCCFFLFYFFFLILFFLALFVFIILILFVHIIICSYWLTVLFIHYFSHFLISSGLSTIWKILVSEIRVNTNKQMKIKSNSIHHSLYTGIIILFCFLLASDFSLLSHLQWKTILL